ncbi:MAG: LON peptidase substrate-binding domain-containing protein [Oscillochloris sp.]|nr:LON peptidase substrate-binding domain-containing protein [Oscillochloris sp.]
MIRQLPLFPLGTLLFPGSTLNLHIFEERYRQMIGRCLEQNSPFGVVLIRDGDEVIEGKTLARPAEPASIGTIARINANVRLDDGRYLLTATGERRFRIQYMLQQAPYLIASVAELPEEPVPDVTLADELRRVYDRYWQAMASATGTPVQAEELPADPAQLSYLLADRLQVKLGRKQQWLEADSDTRLREIIADLRAELMLLPPAGKRKQGESWSGLGSLN